MVQWKRKLCPTHINDSSGFIYAQFLEFWDDTFIIFIFPRLGCINYCHITDQSQITSVYCFSWVCSLAGWFYWFGKSLAGLRCKLTHQLSASTVDKMTQLSVSLPHHQQASLHSFSWQWQRSKGRNKNAPLLWQVCCHPSGGSKLHDQAQSQCSRVLPKGRDRGRHEKLGPLMQPICHTGMA